MIWFKFGVLNVNVGEMFGFMMFVFYVLENIKYNYIWRKFLRNFI